ncbi:hypothetical protein DXI19_17725 [Vibrio parahaemolyticus]|nr:hypothetical protein [Vibrio parahaemolyticus]EGR2567241.1 hypothetical protein [Vibrio parahaemolyticus]EGR3330579.1 hypothetical protein [Vibrio parahaemolyticus]KWU30732.1 hypothetical protein AVL51_19140 [Vibrio parahaemolyticus]OEA85672.1 hypothetical protein BBM70_13510 [Vibrio parahaemolyticus]
MLISSAFADLECSGTYKTPMLKAPQQALNSNNKHFTLLRWFGEPKCAELQNSEPQNLLEQVVSEN